MVFSSVPFLAWLLPITLGLHTLAPRRARNAVLLVASLVFYALGSDKFVIALVGTTLLDHLLTRAMDRPGATEAARRALLVTSLLVNVGVLAWFKYANFAVEQLNAVRSAFGTDALPWTTVLLPIGISFFTFQRISYVIDVHRRVHPPARSAFELLLYVALFPQLIAGPIVRYDDVRREMQDRAVATDDIAAGAARFVVGLAKKVVIADAVAPIADAVFGLESAGTAQAWIGALAYAVQIYFDFSGYSDMAIGLGRMLGFRFPENFLRPYSSQSITDFWRRWHVTLSSWFRDYVYVPLGGSRRRTPRVLANLAIVFLLTGLWHGAAWTFVVWGAYHGAWLVVERLTGQRAFDAAGIEAVVRRTVTALVVVVGWVLFRADSLAVAGSLMQAMVVPTGDVASDAVSMALSNRAVAALGLGLVTFLLPPTTTLGRAVELSGSRIAWARLGLVAVGLPACYLLVSSATFSPFLYFRF